MHPIPAPSEEGSRLFAGLPVGTPILCIDAHTEGEPLRVILSGFDHLEGRTVLERRRDAKERWDHLRTALMWEPRGHADMYGCVVVPAERDDSDFGVLFIHNEGYSTMCGHGVLAMARVAVELGMVPVTVPETRIAMDTPAGQVHATVTVETAPREVSPGSPPRVRAVRFRNVPSWSAGLDLEVDVHGLGRVRYDLGFGGAFYAYVDAGPLGLELVPASVEELIRAGRAIKEAVQRQAPPRHPGDDDLSFLYGTIFTGRAHEDGHHSRHVCVFADGEVDRSPTGTGVSGRLALLAARGEVEAGETLTVESILGSRFRCRIVDRAEAWGIDAVVPEVEGRAFLTGRSEFLVDPEDPFARGFLLR